MSRNAVWAGNKNKTGLALFNSKVMGRMMISTRASTACVLSFSLFVPASGGTNGNGEIIDLNEIHLEYGKKNWETGERPSSHMHFHQALQDTEEKNGMVFLDSMGCFNAVLEFNLEVCGLVSTYLMYCFCPCMCVSV